MSIQEVSAEQLAELFHHYHQALGPDFGCASKPNAETGSKYHNRKKVVWSLLPVWPYWNWLQRPVNRKTQGAIWQSRVRPNGVADGSPLSFLLTGCVIALLGIQPDFCLRCRSCEVNLELAPFTVSVAIARIITKNVLAA